MPAKVKQTADSTASEAAKYRFLSSQGVPTPELLVAISRNQAEVLVLEFLPTIGVDFHSSSQVRDLLELVARLNSVAAETYNPAPGRGMPRADFDARVKAALSRVWLEPPGSVDADRWFHGNQIARDALVSILESLRQFTGLRPSVRQATRELRLTRVAGVCAALPWLMEAVEQGEGFDLRSELMLKTRCLHKGGR